MSGKLNNLTPGSEEEQPEQETELEKGKEEVSLPEKFKTTEELVKAYNELESHLGKRDETDTKMRERLAKLEGNLEAQQKVETRPPEITKEEQAAMTARFKTDFQKDPLVALHNFNAPFMQDARLSRERGDKLEKELTDVKQIERIRVMKELETKARGTGENAKLFDEMIPQIQKELETNKAWKGFENPPEAVFYHLLGKSTKTLARADEEDRESVVEGSSSVIKESKSDAALKKKMVDKIANTKGVSHLR